MTILEAYERSCEPGGPVVFRLPNGRAAYAFRQDRETGLLECPIVDCDGLDPAPRWWGEQVEVEPLGRLDTWSV